MESTIGTGINRPAVNTIIIILSGFKVFPKLRKTQTGNKRDLKKLKLNAYKTIGIHKYFIYIVLP